MRLWEICGKNDNSTVFVEFMLETLNHALDDLAERQRYDTVNDTVYDTVNEPAFDMVNMSEKERSILTLIRKDTNIAIEQLVKKTGFSRSTVTQSLASLRGKIC